jgi:hypothetical protein
MWKCYLLFELFSVCVCVCVCVCKVVCSPNFVSAFWVKYYDSLLHLVAWIILFFLSIPAKLLLLIFPLHVKFLRRSRFRLHANFILKASSSHKVCWAQVSPDVAYFISRARFSIIKWKHISTYCGTIAEGSFSTRDVTYRTNPSVFIHDVTIGWQNSVYLRSW